MIRRTVYIKNGRRIRLMHNGINEMMILMAVIVRLDRNLYILTNLIKNK